MILPVAACEGEPFLGTADRGLCRLGADLRAARMVRGEELDEVASWVRIKPSFLIALEEGDWAAMPRGIYAKGFLRSYAEHLGLDSSVMALRFDEARGLRAVSSPTRRPAPRRQYLPDATAAAAILLLGAVGACAYLLAGTPSFRPMPGPSFPDTLSAGAAEVAPPVALASADVEAGSRAVSAASVTGRVILVGRGPGWVRLSDSTGDFVRSWTVGPGDWIPLPPYRGLALWTGDAGSIEILVDGRSIGAAGPAASVLRGLPLDPDELLARMPAS